MADFLPVFAHSGQFIDTGKLKRSITNLQFSLLNSIMDARLAPEEVDDAVKTIVGDAHSRHVPLLWWIGPSTRPVDLAETLLKYNYILEDVVPGTAVDLAQLPEDLPKPDGFSIQIVQDDEILWRWPRTMMTGFGAPESVTFLASAWHDLMGQTDPQTTYAILGVLNGKPVATPLMFLSAGVAGIHSVATLPEARRQGIGAWMTLYPLLKAHDLGYRVGVLQTSQMGESVYWALGFKNTVLSALTAGSCNVNCWTNC